MLTARVAPLVLGALLLVQPLPAAVQDTLGVRLEQAAAGGLEPDDLVVLDELAAWRELHPDWSFLDGALDRLAGLSRRDPLMDDELRLARARAAATDGRPAEARELFRASGGLERWWAWGPEPLEELSDVAAAAPPAEAGWRPAGGTDPLGWVRLDGLGWPAQRQLLFLATTVRSEREQPVALRLGAAQAARVWLNGEEILTSPQPLRQAPDQLAAGGWLAAGENLLVVAVGCERDAWWLRARLTAPDGTPLAGVREVDGAPRPHTAVGRPAPAVRTLNDELATGSLARAAFLVERAPEGEILGTAVAACRAARAEDPARARWLEWRLTTEPGAARELLEEALAADPALLPARLELARWYADRDLYDTAAALLEAAPPEPAVATAVAQLGARRWGMLALPQLAAAADGAPASFSPWRALAAHAVEASAWPLARRAVARLEELAPGHPATVELAERLATATGDGAVLLDLHRRLLDEDPNRVAVRERLARLLEARGVAGEARTVLEEGLARAPGHVELMLELARLEHADGEDARAAELARDLLRRRPQEQRAAWLLERVGGAAEDMSWRRSPEQLWAMADAARAEGPAVTVLEHQEVHILPGQLIEERVQRAFLVRSPERTEHLERHTIPWVPERQRLRVLAARVLDRDGVRASARQGDTARLSEPAFNLYYDTRLRMLELPDLRAGDLVEITYVLSETAEANDTGPYKGGTILLASELPTHRAEVELVAPPDALPAWRLAHLPGEPERREEDDGTVRLAFAWDDLPAVPRDVPAAPSLVATPHLAYSNRADWGELAEWYGRHVAARVKSSPRLVETAERLTRDVESRRDRIAALFRFVTIDVRYVGLELGEHRFRPFSAEWVLEHRMGDCKDKAALLVTLLEAVGIPARMVLLRTADLGPVALPGLAQLEQFNHAIVYLPEDDLWLDGTAAGADPFIPPCGDQGAWALVVDGPGSRPAPTPVAGCGRQRWRFALAPAEPGVLALEVRTDHTGEAAAALRGTLAGSRDPRRTAAWLQELFPGAELRGEPSFHLVPGRDPATLSVEGRLPRTALLAGGGIALFPGPPPDLARQLAGTRATPLVVPPTPDLEWVLEVELGRAPGALPEPVALADRWGSLDLGVTPTPTGYRLDGRLHLEAGLVRPDELAGLRELLVAMERALDRRLEVP